MADIAAIPEIGGDTAPNNATYFSDKIHPTTAGNDLIAPVVAAAVRRSLV
jgi:phospholipase/lecithinase/hemolysin